jgi:hypothetical protein
MPITINGSHGVSANNVLIGTSQSKPATSARAILAANPNAPSGWYWISFPGTTNNTPILTYCDMRGAESGSLLGGWMRLDDAWANDNWQKLYDHSQGASSNYFWIYTELTTETASYARYINTTGMPDGHLRTFRFKLPTGSRGVRVTKFRFYALNGADGYAHNDSASSNPTTAQIISAGEGNAVGLGANYASFGIYFGNGTSGARLFKTSPEWAGEVSSTFVTLTTTAFNQFDDIGSDADRIIWFESDDPGERSQVYNFTFWIR